MLHFLPASINTGLSDDIALLAMISGLLGPQLALMFAMRKAARGGSYERRFAGSRKVYSPPPAFACGAVAFVLFYPVLLFAEIPHSVFAPVFQRWAAPSHPGMARDLLLVACVIGLACGAAIRVLRCCTLTLNLQERTYRSVDLSSLSLKAQSGSWVDIAGVHVYSGNRRRPDEGIAYFVGLKLPGGRKVYSVLGGFRRREQAEAYAAKAARELGLLLLSDTGYQVEKGRSGRGF